MNPHAQALGALGGKSTSDAKKAAARENGKKGGRPLSVDKALGKVLLAATAYNRTAQDKDLDRAIEAVWHWRDNNPVV